MIYNVYSIARVFQSGKKSWDSAHFSTVAHTSKGGIWERTVSFRIPLCWLGILHEFAFVFNCILFSLASLFSMDH